MKSIIDTILKYDAIFEEAEEGGFAVSVPSLPGCISEGDTFEEAKTNITEAITVYLESMAKDEIPVKSSSGTFIGSIEVPFSSLSFAK